MTPQLFRRGVGLTIQCVRSSSTRLWITRLIRHGLTLQQSGCTNGPSPHAGSGQTKPGHGAVPQRSGGAAGFRHRLIA